MINPNYKHSELSEKIIKSFYSVYNTLGYGFLEKVYRNSLIVELEKRGMKCYAEKRIDVYYDDKRVGYYYADIVVNDCFIIEVKAAEALCERHEAQLTNYLKASEIEVGLLLNFGVNPQFKRKVFSSEFKQKDHNKS